MSLLKKSPDLSTPPLSPTSSTPTTNACMPSGTTNKAVAGQHAHDTVMVAPCTPATLETLAAALAPAAGALFFVEARFLAGVAAAASSADSVFGEELAPQLVSQFGLAIRPVENLGVTMFTRTSGVLLIAGVGSYCAYRLGRRLLAGCRPPSTWTLFESRNCDLLARADTRLLHPAAEGFYEVRIGEGDLREFQKFFENIDDNSATVSKIKNCNDGNAKDNNGKNTLLVEKLIGRDATKLKDSGLAGILSIGNEGVELHDTDEDDTLKLFASLQFKLHEQPARRARSTTSNAHIYSLRAKFSPLKKRPLSLDNNADDDADQDDDCISISARSDLTSVSRMRDGAALRIAVQQQQKAAAAQKTRNAASTSVKYKDESSLISCRERIAPVYSDDDSTVSTSLRLTWQDEPFWDDEFANDVDSSYDNCPSHASTSISELSAFKNLQTMFEDRDRRDRNSVVQRPLKLQRLPVSSSSREITPIEINYHKRKSRLRNSLHRREANLASVSLLSTSQASFSGYGNDNGSSIRGASSTLSKWNDEILERCMKNDTDYMYHSTTVARGDFAPSDVMSEASNFSTARYIARLRQRSSVSPHGSRLQLEGLWELASTSRDVSPSDVSSYSRQSIEKCYDTSERSEFEKRPKEGATIFSRTDAVMPMLSSSCGKKKFFHNRKKDLYNSKMKLEVCTHATQLSSTTAVEKEKTTRRSKNWMTDSCFSKSSCGSSSIDSTSVTTTGKSDFNRPVSRNREQSVSAMFDSAIAMTESVSSTAISTSATTTQQLTDDQKMADLTMKATTMPIES